MLEPTREWGCDAKCYFPNNMTDFHWYIEPLQICSLHMIVPKVSS